MSDGLLSALNITKAAQKIGMSEERIRDVLPIINSYISFWREYPDIFIDMLLHPGSTFNLFYYQRIFLACGDPSQILLWNIPSCVL